jgi:dodecin
VGGGGRSGHHDGRGSVRDLRVAEVTKQDIVVGDDGALVYRTKIQLSFKYESE